MARQQQSAGEQSQQYQAGRNLHVHGVSAADVVAITRVEVARVLDELSAAAESVAAERLERFKAKIVEEFAEDEGLRSAFADPDFQFSLGDASRAAVSNDDQHTEDLLVQLLKNRAEQGNYSRVRLATSYAIRAADKLSLDALHGLTGVWALSSLAAHTPGVAAQLVSSQSIAVSLSAMGLPEDHTWAQDADALNLVQRWTQHDSAAVQTDPDGGRDPVPQPRH